MAWLGLAWLGLAWLGLAWLGLAWLGSARLGSADYCIQSAFTGENARANTFCYNRIRYFKTQAIMGSGS